MTLIRVVCDFFNCRGVGKFHAYQDRFMGESENLRAKPSLKDVV